MRRYLTKRLHNPGSDRALSSAPLPPPALDGGYNNNAGWVARGLTSSGDGSLVASTLRWSAALLSPWGERVGGAARRLVGFLAGVRRTKIEAGRYKAEWIMTLSAGGRKRGGAAALVAGTCTGSQGVTVVAVVVRCAVTLVVDAIVRTLMEKEAKSRAGCCVTRCRRLVQSHAYVQ